jgi:diguanylate cyclase (GGDEF)-like protein/PAS domain S-box-containing protein
MKNKKMCLNPEQRYSNLRTNIACLQCILESTADGLLAVDNKGKVIHMNKRFSELWRIPQEILESRDDNILLNFVLEQLIDPESFLSKVKYLFNSNSEDRDRLLFKDGRIFERYSSQMIMNKEIIGRVWSFRDITIREQTEKALRESEARYRSVVEDQTELICRYRKDGKLTFINAAYARYYGKRREELHNKNFIPHIPEPDMTMILQRLSGITPDNPLVVLEHTIIMPDNQVRWQRWTHRGIFLDDGRLVEYQAVGTDYTERKRTEDELQFIKESLQVSNKELEQSLLREKELANIDSLTGVNNHRRLMDLAGQMFNVAARYLQPFSIVMFDIDYFKDINDHFGHLTGDTVLKTVIQVVSSQIRTSDIIGRYGGDEFVIVLPMTTLRKTGNLAKRIQEAVKKIQVQTLKGKAAVTISIGIAEMLQSQQDSQVESIINRADEAMYTAKHKGRNQIIKYKEKQGTY